MRPGCLVKLSLARCPQTAMARKKPSPFSKERRNRSIPRATFVRLIKEICSELTEQEHNWAEDAVDGLHEYAEAYLERHFGRANQLLNAFEQRTLSLKHFKSAAEAAG